MQKPDEEVRDRHLVGVAPASPEANTPFHVDSNTVFAIAVARQHWSSLFPEALSDLDVASAPSEV